MSYDPRKRDGTWRMVAPGLYFDPAGFGHIFPDELLAFLSVAHPKARFDPNSKSDYELVVLEFTHMLEQEHPGMKFEFIKHEREEN